MVSLIRYSNLLIDIRFSFDIFGISIVIRGISMIILGMLKICDFYGVAMSHIFDTSSILI